MSLRDCVHAHKSNTSSQEADPTHVKALRLTFPHMENTGHIMYRHRGSHTLRQVACQSATCDRSTHCYMFAQTADTGYTPRQLIRAIALVKSCISTRLCRVHDLAQGHARQLWLIVPLKASHVKACSLAQYDTAHDTPLTPFESLGLATGTSTTTHLLERKAVRCNSVVPTPRGKQWRKVHISVRAEGLKDITHMVVRMYDTDAVVEVHNRNRTNLAQCSLSTHPGSETVFEDENALLENPARASCTPSAAAPPVVIRSRNRGKTCLSNLHGTI